MNLDKIRFKVIIIVIVGLFLFIAFNQHDNKNDHQIDTLIFNDTLVIKQDEIKYNFEQHVSIYFDSVLTDSRCPKNSKCKWAGNAEVKLIFKNKNSKTNIILNTHGGDRFKTDSLINEYRIQLINLFPYPETIELIKQEDYSAEIMIKKE